MQLFTLTETARFFKISTAELKALVTAGEIPFVMVGGKLRFRCDHLVKFIRESTRQAQSEWLPDGE
ncbi:MAG: helix-turn-helix domain-containing protein [Deltaproteobacteria bacterium]|nr:helix-turn-helix domain-containing protein [Deltaproteobacteria bacterium]